MANRHITYIVLVNQVFTLLIYQASMEVHSMITITDPTVISNDHPKACINPVLSIPLI